MYASFPLRPACLRLGEVHRRLRDPEVDELHPPVVGHEHVLRAHVAVDDVERLPS